MCIITCVLKSLYVSYGKPTLGTHVGLSTLNPNLEPSLGANIRLLVFGVGLVIRATHARLSKTFQSDPH